jgi:inorganic pyrophosphatase
MTVDVFIEISKGGLVKYEFDEEKRRLRVDRFLHGAMYFPFNYGFIEDTLGEDNDPLDAVVLSTKPTLPGTLMKCRAIGLLEMEDEGGIDTKIVLVPDLKIDPLFGKIEDLKKVEESTKAKVKNFFEHYKDLEKGKWVKLKEWQGREAAEKEIKAAHKRAKK